MITNDETKQQKRNSKHAMFGSYQLLRTIGEGEFGKVKLGIKINTQTAVAIKLIKKKSVLTQNKLTKLCQEISILERVKHPYIIKTYEVIEDDEYIGIIMEYASGGELFEYILAHCYLEEHEAKKYFAQLLSGINYLHRNQIVHRDLKLENLLLDSTHNIVITDFGFATLSKTGENKLLTTSCGSPCYAAPELVVSEGYVGEAADIWSCGVILYSMLCGYLPFDDDPNNPDGENIHLLYRYILETEVTFPDYISQEAKNLLKGILNPNPMARFTMNQIINHPWICEYKDFILLEYDENNEVILPKNYLEGKTETDEVNNNNQVAGHYKTSASQIFSSTEDEEKDMNYESESSQEANHVLPEISTIDSDQYIDFIKQSDCDTSYSNVPQSANSESSDNRPDSKQNYYNDSFTLPADSLSNYFTDSSAGNNPNGMELSSPTQAVVPIPTDHTKNSKTTTTTTTTTTTPPITTTLDNSNNNNNNNNKSIHDKSNENNTKENRNSHSMINNESIENIDTNNKYQKSLNGDHSFSLNSQVSDRISMNLNNIKISRSNISLSARKRLSIMTTSSTSISISSKDNTNKRFSTRFMDQSEMTNNSNSTLVLPLKNEQPTTTNISTTTTPLKDSQSELPKTTTDQTIDIKEIQSQSTSQQLSQQQEIQKPKQIQSQPLPPPSLPPQTISNSNKVDDDFVMEEEKIIVDNPSIDQNNSLEKKNTKGKENNHPSIITDMILLDIDKHSPTDHLTTELTETVTETVVPETSANITTENSKKQTELTEEKELISPTNPYIKNFNGIIDSRALTVTPPFVVFLEIQRTLIEQGIEFKVLNNCFKIKCQKKFDVEALSPKKEDVLESNKKEGEEKKLLVIDKEKSPIISRQNSDKSLPPLSPVNDNLLNEDGCHQEIENNENSQLVSKVEIDHHHYHHHDHEEDDEDYDKDQYSKNSTPRCQNFNTCYGGTTKIKSFMNSILECKKPGHHMSGSGSGNSSSDENSKLRKQKLFSMNSRKLKNKSLIVFTIEICRIKNRNELYIVKIKRRKGDVWLFKDIYNQILSQLPLNV